MFNSSALVAPLIKSGLLRSKYLSAFLAFKAFVAILRATLKPIAPGTPICTNASTNLPAAFSCAISSNGFILSKNTSTSAARFVSAPKSINSAPNETTPSGTLIIPDTNPAAAALKAFLSLPNSSSPKPMKPSGSKSVSYAI